LYWEYVKKHYDQVKKEWKSQDKEIRRCVYFISFLFSFIIFSPKLPQIYNIFRKRIISFIKPIRIDPHHFGKHRYIPNNKLIRNVIYRSV